MRDFFIQLKSKFCALLWTILGLEVLVILYLLVPPPLEPIIVVAPTLATISGDNILSEDSKKAHYTISLNKNLDSDLNLTLAYSGTAINGVDFKGPTHIILKENELTAHFEVLSIDDNEKEFNEIFAIKIVNITGKNFLSDIQPNDLGGVVYTKILDEKRPLKADTQTNYLNLTCNPKLYENNKSITCQAVLTQAALEDISLDIVYEGKAIFNEDYTATTSIIIPKGKKQTTFKITSIDDITKETQEFIEVSIAPLKESSFEDLRRANTQQRVVLLDEKIPTKAVTLTLKAPQKVHEGQALTYTLELSQSASQPIKVVLKHSQNTTAFEPINTVLIEANSRKKSFVVVTKDNNIINPNNFITYAIKSVEQDGLEKVAYSSKSLRTKIVDEKAPVNADEESALLSILTDSRDFYEDDSKLTITLHLSQKAQKDMPIIVTYTGSAQHKVDFKAPQKVILKKGHQDITLTLTPINDNISEDPENITITLKNKTDAGLEDLRITKALTVSLHDDKELSHSPQATLTLTGPTQVSEPRTTKAYTLRLSQKAQKELLITLQYSGSATKEDYTQVSRVTLNKGSKTTHFKIKTLNDEIIENPENFEIRIQEVSGGGLENLSISSQQVTTKITDEKDISIAFDEIISKQVVEFETGSSEINEDSFKALDKIASLLQQFSFAKIEIQGHTNSIGNADKNLELSQQRAQSIKTYLLEKGIDKKRIKAIGYGESQPLIPIDNPNAAEFNKRVEFKVIN